LIQIEGQRERKKNTYKGIQVHRQRVYSEKRIITFNHMEAGRERDRDRQRDRQTDRQTHTHTQRERERERERERQTDRMR
jgi:hypothetical protein